MSDPGSAPKVGFEWCGCDEFWKEAREIAILTPGDPLGPHVDI